MPSFQYRLPIRNDLTRLQRLAIDDDNSIFVTGVPGSGKTVVAIYRVARLNNDSKLFTYTRMLTVAIKGAVNNNLREASNKVTSIYEWFAINCNVRLGEIINSEEQISVILKNNNISFTELLFDEAQDLPITLYASLSKVCDRISIGADDAQQVFRNGCTEKELLQIFNRHSHHELDENHRNTYEIFNFARHFIPENERAQNPNWLGRLESKRRGDKPSIILYSQRTVIIETIRQIINDNIGGNIGVLLLHSNDVDTYFNLINPGIHPDCCYYHNRMPRAARTSVENDLKNILVTTFKSAKGMEFDTVIMPELQMIDVEYKQQFFVGCTRARANLFLFCQGEIPNIIDTAYFNNTYLLQDFRREERDDPEEEDLPF